MVVAMAAADCGVVSGSSTANWSPPNRATRSLRPPRAPAQDGGQDPQHFVARLLAELVVEPPEMIHVQQQQRQRLATALRLAQRLRQFLVETGRFGSPVSESDWAWWRVRRSRRSAHTMRRCPAPPGWHRRKPGVAETQQQERQQERQRRGDRYRSPDSVQPTQAEQQQGRDDQRDRQQQLHGQAERDDGIPMQQHVQYVGLVIHCGQARIRGVAGQARPVARRSQGRWRPPISSARATSTLQRAPSIHPRRKRAGSHRADRHTAPAPGSRAPSAARVDLFRLGVAQARTGAWCPRRMPAAGSVPAPATASARNPRPRAGTHRGPRHRHPGPCPRARARRQKRRTPGWASIRRWGRCGFPLRHTPAAPPCRFCSRPARAGHRLRDRTGPDRTTGCPGQRHPPPAAVRRSINSAWVRRDHGQRPSSARLFWSIATTTIRSSAGREVAWATVS